MPASNYFWARWLKTALMKDPFVAPRIIEVPGWELRGRPLSDFSFLPSGTVDHHTACMIRRGHDPQSCLNGCLAGNAVAPGPIGQLLGTWTPPGVRWNGVADPRIIIMAAGRANHAGVGEYPWGAPTGNGSSIGIEWCGPPEVGSWPDIVVELRARVTAAILKHNGWPVTHSTIHWEYARPVGRKIDQSGPWPWEPNLGPVMHWNPVLWRREVAKYLFAQPTPQPPPPEDIDMLVLEWGQPGTANWTVFSWNGPQLAWVHGGGANPVLNRAGIKRQTVTDAELLSIINSTQQTTEAPSTLTPALAAAWSEA